MIPGIRTIPQPKLSRRQFGLVLGGGAVLLVAGGAYGVVARTQPSTGPTAATPFGTLRLVRAGRLARLDADGQPAAHTAHAALARLAAAGSPVPGFNYVSALKADHGSHTDGHGEAGGAGSPWPQPANLTWGDVVVLELELHNNRPEPMLFAPGQLRLKLSDAGSAATTVTPQDTGRSPGTLAPGATELIWISYLAPPDASELQLEYTDPQQDFKTALPLMPVMMSKVRP
ncbi:DUF4352 domain-containing protein [Arthrobacter cavernae]|uniref:DUF4352 domain-containing protein n=1 Tax=Arthrobacter cavernae TaxID=2817681 RepID=A0A939KQ29_9MICC|nr:DUF4352 domain-containing protein [Arthrobacter cavernae]MBO1269580.1 hypothetical protein [Arthrobacter cavernae]